ncbi:MAG: phospholipid/cholesterol/gamma-HCH transport system substrate-binding protein [Cyclobacteriaceae bacterium]|jgi:phospholipid/cholesterol/gamma-HCH transport system substrate-binding protein
MSKQFKVGLIALLSGAILYWGFNFLKGNDFFSPTNKYYVIYDNVDGLNKSNPVIINGLAVGRVSAIRLLQDQANNVLVEIDIDETVVLGKTAQAALSNTDFLGSKGIILTVGDLNQPIVPGDTLEAIVDRGIGEIIDSAAPIANTLNTTITRVNEILIGLKGSGEKINATIGELQIMTENINAMIGANRKSVNQIIASTNYLLENLNDKVDMLTPLMEKSETVLDSLGSININRTLAGVDTVLFNLNETLLYFKESQGTIGKLMNEDSVYNNLNKLLVDLDKLTIHFDQYPKDFMKPLGRKHKKLEATSEK